MAEILNIMARWCESWLGVFLLIDISTEVTGVSFFMRKTKCFTDSLNPPPSPPDLNIHIFTPCVCVLCAVTITCHKTWDKRLSEVQKATVHIQQEGVARQAAYGQHAQQRRITWIWSHHSTRLFIHIFLQVAPGLIMWTERGVSSHRVEAEDTSLQPLPESDTSHETLFSPPNCLAVYFST